MSQKYLTYCLSSKKLWKKSQKGCSYAWSWSTKGFSAFPQNRKSYWKLKQRNIFEMSFGFSCSWKWGIWHLLYWNYVFQSDLTKMTQEIPKLSTICQSYFRTCLRLWGPWYRAHSKLIWAILIDICGCAKVPGYFIRYPKTSSQILKLFLDIPESSS